MKFANYCCIFKGVIPLLNFTCYAMFQCFFSQLNILLLTQCTRTCPLVKAIPISSKITLSSTLGILNLSFSGFVFNLNLADDDIGCITDVQKKKIISTKLQYLCILLWLLGSHLNGSFKQIIYTN